MGSINAFQNGRHIRTTVSTNAEVFETSRRKPKLQAFLCFVLLFLFMHWYQRLIYAKWALLLAQKNVDIFLHKRFKQTHKTDQITQSKAIGRGVVCRSAAASRDAQSPPPPQRRSIVFRRLMRTASEREPWKPGKWGLKKGYPGLVVQRALQNE